MDLRLWVLWRARRLQPRDDTRTRFDGDGNTGSGSADASLVPGQLNTTDKRHPFGGGVFVVAGLRGLRPQFANPSVYDYNRAYRVLLFLAYLGY